MAMISSVPRAVPSTGRDVRTVGWLRWRQFRDDAVYWLRVLGYQPGDKALSQQFYVIYLLIFGLIWVAAMFAYFGDMAARLADTLTPAALPDVFTGLSWAIAIGQAYVIGAALRSTPLKLTFPDMAYLAASPVNRAAPALLGLARLLLTRCAVLLPPLLLIALFVLRIVREPLTPADGLRVLGFGAVLIAITWGLAWALGLPRLIDARLNRLRGLWLLPALIVPLAVLVPEIGLISGRLLELAILDQLPLGVYVGAIALAAVVIGLAVRLGGAINMTQAVDESLVYARIQALGTLAWTQPQVQAKIRLQTLGGGRRAFLKLPTAQGYAALLTRSALSYVRHPLALIAVLAWGFVLTTAAIAIVTGAQPFQVWLAWMLAVGLLPPAGLFRVYRSDVEEPFLRQFLPVDGLELLVADAALPFFALLIGGGAALAIGGLPEPVLLVALIALPLSAIVITLIGAWSLTQRRMLQSRLFGMLLAFGVAAGAGAATGSPFIGVGVLAFAAIIAAGLVLQDA